MGRMCPICGKLQKNLYTHLSRTHKLDNMQRKYWIGQEQLQKSGQRFTPYPQTQNVEDTKCDRFQLLHPFTAIVAGMTGSGKTVWVQNLLEHASRVIQPPPQRIVWSYSQWQPVYNQMQQTLPGIEFVKGIPHDLDEDWYFDPQTNNLIVIDDQMAETSNDKRILNLFTKGSHHRNLSVIFLCQNVYFQGKIMRTLSLNTAYLVLFKNPRDKLQITTLGKQMYPGKTDQFLHKYEAAVQRPYGYLFVDLKPNTSEECRLRTNVLPSDSPHPPAPTQSSADPSGMKTMANYFKKQSYMQPPVLNVMQNISDQMQDVLSQPFSPDEFKSEEYSQLLNRFLELQRKVSYSLPKIASGVRSPQQHNALTATKEVQGPPPITPLKYKTLEQPLFLSPSSSAADSDKALVSPTILATPAPSTPTASHGFFLTPPPSSEIPKWLNYEGSDKKKDSSPSTKKTKVV